MCSMRGAAHSPPAPLASPVRTTPSAPGARRSGMHRTVNLPGALAGPGGKRCFSAHGNAGCHRRPPATARRWIALDLATGDGAVINRGANIVADAEDGTSWVFCTTSAANANVPGLIAIDRSAALSAISRRRFLSPCSTQSSASGSNLNSKHSSLTALGKHGWATYFTVIFPNVGLLYAPCLLLS